MDSEMKVYSYPDGEIQRVQVVRWDDWSQLDFLHLKQNDAALDCFYDIYRNYLVPGCPWIFGRMILFQLPKDLDVELPSSTEKYGVVGDKLTAASVVLQEGVKIAGGKPVFQNEQAKKLWKILEERDCVRIVCGKLPFTKVIPVGSFTGYLSETEPDVAMKVNANFFIMDPIDCATIYDQVGTVLGLCVKDGVVENPPLFGREALLVKKDDRVTIAEPDVRELEIEINGKRYKHGVNATIYTRPEAAKTPGDKGKKLAIIGRRVAAVKDGGSMQIPAAGFVLCPWERGGADEASACVTYHGMEDVQFGIQVGNSIIRDGVKTEHFISRFYNVRKLEKVPFPPSLYPMDFEKARAARIALGADADGKPMLFWAEGAGKLGYTPGKDSTGASLSEMAEIAADLGMVNAVNLDGGGSAQILLENKRALRISDRNKADNSDAERLVPLGLIVRFGDE
ncbi:MAG: phosphodiester glycosidase family protein [Roseburia sp.]|nr:phosphodiester glycosidase family protein [Roseburia sp.]